MTKSVSEVDSTSVPELRDELRAFGAAYDYDVGYLEQLLDGSPGGFGAFRGAQALSHYRARLPLAAHFVARIAAMQEDDCGACAQLNLQMAQEAGVEHDVLAQLVEEPGGLPEDLLRVRELARCVVRGENAPAALVASLQEDYGVEGHAELALAIAGARIYPSLKRAFGAAHACRPLQL